MLYLVSFHHVDRDSAISTGTKLSYNSVQGFSYFFNGDSKLDFSLELDPALLPIVTIGGWVKPSFNDRMALNPRLDFISLA